MDNYSASKTHFPGRINQIKNALHFGKGSGSAAALPASQKLLALTIVSQSALALVKGRLSTSVDQRCTVLCALFNQDPAAWNLQQQVRLSHPTEDLDFLVNGPDLLGADGLDLLHKVLDGGEGVLFRPQCFNQALHLDGCDFHAAHPEDAQERRAVRCKANAAVLF